MKNGRSMWESDAGYERQDGVSAGVVLVVGWNGGCCYECCGAGGGVSRYREERWVDEGGRGGQAGTETRDAIHVS